MDYYKILDVPKTANKEEIKRAYKKKAMSHHPDKGGDETIFKQINEAYQVLSDPQKKSNYDQYGSTDPQSTSFNFRSGSHHDYDIDEIFKNFGVHFGGGFSRQQRRNKNKDIRIAYQINFKDIFTGITEDISYRLPNGDMEALTVQVPPGARNGTQIKFSGYGDNTFKELPRGDLIVSIQINNTTDYRIEGNDIHTTIFLDVFDFILGKRQELNLPDNTTISLTIPASTNPGTVFSVNNHGLPDISTGMRGRLFVELKAEVKRYTDTQYKIIEQARNSLT